MRAIVLENPGKDGRYVVKDCPAPQAGKGQVLVRVHYAGINRADLLQKQGRYPLPERTPRIPGLEFAGDVTECGPGVLQFAPGDKVCGIVSEGAFAETVTVDATHLLPVPPGLTLEQAAALPEACFTAWISFVWQAKLAPGETVLIHGGTGGVGSVAIQIANLLGASVITTGGSGPKCELARKLGARHAINYHDADFVQAVLRETEGRGADVILDMVGGDYFERNLASLARGGRLAIIAFLKGSNMQANLGPILLKHLSVMGSTLRSRPGAEKARLAAEIKTSIWKATTTGDLRPVIDHVFPLEEGGKALERMQEGLNIGKILLKL